MVGAEIWGGRGNDLLQVSTSGASRGREEHARELRGLAHTLLADSLEIPHWLLKLLQATLKVVTEEEVVVATVLLVCESKVRFASRCLLP